MNHIKLNRDPKQEELIKLAGSRDKSVSQAAMEILAGLFGPIIQTVIDKAAVSDSIYTTVEFNQDETPSIPLDLYIDKKVDYVRVWSQSIAGGLPSNLIQGLTELKFSTYDLDSAVSMLKKFARVGGLNNVARALNRMAQEILVKQELNRFTPVLAAVAGATTNNLSHVIAATTTGTLQLDDFNRLLTRGRKINAAFDGGTPTAGTSRGITDLFLSPELLEDIRGFVYEPMNTRTVPAGGANTAVPLPDSIREEIYRSAGASEVFGISIHEVLELSPEGQYNVIFDNYYGGSFTPGTSQLALGVDMTRESIISPVELDENGGRVSVMVDDQFLARSEKVAWYGKKSEGSLILDDRCLAALVV